MLPVLRQGVPVFGSAGCPGNLGIPLPFRGVHGGQCACPALGWGRIHILGKLFVASPRGPVSRNPNRPPTHRRTVGLPHGIPRTGYPCPLHRQSLPFSAIYPPKSPRRISQVSPPTRKPSNSFTQPLLPATCCGIAETVHHNLARYFRCGTLGHSRFGEIFDTDYFVERIPFLECDGWQRLLG